MDRQAHWQNVYQTKDPDQVSWFQAEARLSRELIERAAPDRSARIIDLGAGASTLVDELLSAGYRALCVVDIAEAALAVSKGRLGQAAEFVDWRVDDILIATFPAAAFDVWHDRAVFHFLTNAEDRVRYIAQVKHAVSPGGHVLIATFAEDGPIRCSGLEVARYSPSALHAEFGAEFEMRESHREAHTTPGGATQAFTYCLFRHVPST